eukprot:CAMPEP_0180292964 /NCGR_PEP_ID=MMETSP0988-20121125/17173_1 /TAXON_ID=697907 /ORGANISM="non described non described, Strain CCMP2293" /LENGTH=231 /DNA_ID=CAMNT_0022269365 /DNA_START=42 /DNA_END=738 /DNA_ORIENTATION=-
MGKFLASVLLAGAVWGVAGFVKAMRGAGGRDGAAGATAQTQADMTKKNPWMIVEKKAPRTAFLCNGWKNEAENARNLGWTSSSVETMVRMQREAATADLMKLVMPLLMAKAADEKNLQDNPAATPNPKMANLEVIAAISVGSGSAAAVYSMSESVYTIDYLFCNTQTAGQLQSQNVVIKHIVGLAEKAGVKEVRLAPLSFVPGQETIFGTLAEIGFEEAGAGVPWAVYKGL